MHHEVAVAGSGTNAFGDRFGLVRTYDEKTGTLLWHDEVGMAGRHDDLLAIVAVRGMLVAVGTSTPRDANGQMDLSSADALIAAYVP